MTLPLGSYHIEETKPPYGYIGTTESYDVTFAWDNELNDVVMATSIAKVDGAASSQSFEVVRSKDANADFTEQQTLKFYNDREKAKVGIYKTDLESGKYLAGAVFNLYTADDIYDADGSLVFAAGELVATSPETNADGTTYFDCDIPIRGEQYGSSPQGRRHQQRQVYHRGNPCPAGLLCQRRTHGSHLYLRRADCAYFGKHLYRQTHRNVGKQARFDQ